MLKKRETTIKSKVFKKIDREEYREGKLKRKWERYEEKFN